jgi:hypothetical protein
MLVTQQRLYISSSAKWLGKEIIRILNNIEALTQGEESGYEDEKQIHADHRLTLDIRMQYSLNCHRIRQRDRSPDVDVGSNLCR